MIPSELPPKPWLISYSAKYQRVRVSSIDDLKTLREFDFSARSEIDSTWNVLAPDSMIFLSGSDWLAVMQPETGTVEVFDGFPSRVSSLIVFDRLHLNKRRLVALDFSNYLHIYRRGSPEHERNIKLQGWTKYLIEVSGAMYVIRSSRIQKLHLDWLDARQELSSGDILARLSVCKLRLKETDSTGYYNERAREETGYLSSQIAANNYNIMLAEDSACYAAGALYDYWRANLPYKPIRDSIFQTLAEMIDFRWLVTGDKSAPETHGSVRVDNQLRQIESVFGDTLVPDHLFVHLERKARDFVASVDPNTGTLHWIIPLAQQYRRTKEDVWKISPNSQLIALMMNQLDSMLIVDYTNGSVVHNWSFAPDNDYYRPVNWANDAGARLLNFNSHGVTLSFIRQIDGANAFDIYLERYIAEGKRVSRKVIRKNVSTSIARRSSVSASGDYIICRYKRYRDWNNVVVDSNYFDSLLVYDARDFSEVSSFAVNGGVRSLLVGDHFVTADSLALRGYSLRDGHLAFNYPFKYRSGRPFSKRLAKISDKQFIHIDTLSVTSFWIDESAESGLRQEFTTRVFEADGRISYVYTKYLGHFNNQLVFAKDYTMNGISSVTGKRTFTRPVLRGRFSIRRDDVAYHDSALIIGSGPYLYKVSMENLCE